MKDEEGGENGTFGAREIMSFFDSLARSHLDTLSYPILAPPMSIYLPGALLE